MEGSLHSNPWRFVGKSEGGYIIELYGEQHVIPEKMVLTVLAKLLARHCSEAAPN
ncbi:hypothetical protein BT69DRAFT_1283410 [Atractiella rhizophila]|nr:hypothetical protein BT69DRAFT_1283410 [Atractiella rhizophila]